MPPADPILTPLGLDRLVDERGLMRDPATGTLEQAGLRTVAAPPEFLRSLRFVLNQETGGTWTTVAKAGGLAAGKAIGEHLDATLARAGKPALSALPLDACLALLERRLATEGWGRVQLDLSAAADHGVIVARLQHSPFVEALPDMNDFVDPLLAGLLAGFFQHISGEPLGCDEIACARRGALECVFVITAEERLAPLRPLFGRESADALIARLKS
jgi:predicted hydrocarbon binding protein